MNECTYLLRSVALAMLVAVTTFAGLEPLDSYVGRYSLSVDGGGDLSAPYTVQVHKPNNTATVVAAYVMAAAVDGEQVTDGAVRIDGTPISWDTTVQNGAFHNAVADVTSLLKPTLDAASVISPDGLRIAFTFTEPGEVDTIDGCALAVVFSDPQAPQQSILLLFGGQSPTGDRFSITTGEPIPQNGVADMGLGISYSYQPSAQTSIVEVNGQRLTSTAGGHDDRERSSIHEAGALITVGGLDDSNDNPVSPSTWTPGDQGSPPIASHPRDDDELYSLLPFIGESVVPSEVGASATNIQVTTLNPSNDDNIFFAYFVLSGAAVLGEGAVLTPSESSRQVGTSQELTVSIVDAGGNPVSGRSVQFEVISGPNSGAQSSVLVTDSAGAASWSLADQAATGGIDTIRASFLDSNSSERFSNIATVAWSDSEQPGFQVVELYEGWNLITLIVTPDERDPEELFGPGSYVYAFRKSGNGFDRTYDYDLVIGANALSGGTTYWVYEPSGSESISPTVFSRSVSFAGTRNDSRNETLTRAWNLFGTNQEQLLPSTSVILSVWAWDAAAQEYVRPDTDSATGRYLLAPGHGHFIFVSSPAVLPIAETPETED